MFSQQLEKFSYWENKFKKMGNWFLIGKHIDFNLVICPPLGTVRGGH